MNIRDFEKVEKIHGLRLDGMSYAQIGKIINLSRQRVQQLISPSPEIKKCVLTRANGKCESCGVIVGKAGHIHHKTNGKDFNDVANLLLLCISCHRTIHQGKAHYREWRHTAL